MKTHHVIGIAGIVLILIGLYRVQKARKAREAERPLALPAPRAPVEPSPLRQERTRWRADAHKLGYAALACVSMGLLLGAGCQVLPQASPQAQLFAQAAASGAIKLPTVAPPIQQTFTVARGTITDAVTVPGKIAPARSADLNFPVGGTLSRILGHSGQKTQEGEPLAELRLSPEDLQAAQRQATLAQLTYENQQAKVDQLKAGAQPGVLADAQAAVARAHVALQTAMLLRDQLLGQPAQDDVGQTRLALDQANADVAAATQAHDDAAAAAARDQQREQTAADQTLAQQRADAQERRETAAAAVRAAQRRVTDATSKLNGVLTDQGTAKAAREKRVQLAQLAVQEANAAVEAAQAAAQQARAQAADPHHAAGAAEAVATADAAVRQAQIRVQVETTHVEEARAALTTETDEDAVTEARQALDQTQDDLQQAQAAATRAQQSVDALNASQPSPTPTAASAASDASSDPAVRAAQQRADAAALKLDQLQAARASLAAKSNTQVQLAQLEVEAKKADVAAAEARLRDLQNTTAVATIDREERLAELLRGEADDARAAAQPTFILRAPFDGLVTALPVSVGQTVQPRTTVVRYADAQRLSVLATAADSEATQLSAGQAVDITLPGLQDRKLQGTIVDVGDAAAVDDTTKQTRYPVRVDLGTALDALQLKIGMTAVVSLNLRQVDDVLHIPTAAVRHVNGKMLVSKMDGDGQLSDVEVRLGESYGSDVVLLGGLDVGDTVAIVSMPPTANLLSARNP
jgi:multidrug efflux pump subunit AcrA (membrane-fusion protein)